VRTHGRVLSADFVAGSSAQLLGVAIAGVLVGSVGVRWSILGLGLGVTAVATAAYVADRRDREPALLPAGGPAAVLSPAAAPAASD
jgi:hypothetical protein